jgi:hypothetical protein
MNRSQAMGTRRLELGGAFVYVRVVNTVNSERLRAKKFQK